MEKRILGRGLEVSAIGLSCMGFTHAYGPAMEEQAASRVLTSAVDMGYTFFDTAECYLGRQSGQQCAIDEALAGLKISAVFGGSPILNNQPAAAPKGAAS